MKALKFFIPALSGILILFGWHYVVNAPNQPIQGETLAGQSPLEFPDSQTTQLLSQPEADVLVATIVEAINNKNVEFFLPYLLERDQNIENVEVALEHYNTYFQGEEITNFEWFNIEELGATSESVPIKRFSYRLSSPSGITKEIEIYQDQNIRFVDPFLLYSFYANRLVEKYTNAVKSQDIEQISQIFNNEVELYNQQELKSALAKYKESLSLDSLSYRFTGLNSEQQYFTYTLLGSNGKEHEIQVIYGDGLVGIRDDLLPTKN
jgi:hypothetical protein